MKRIKNNHMEKGLKCYRCKMLILSKINTVNFTSRHINIKTIESQGRRRREKPHSTTQYRVVPLYKWNSSPVSILFLRLDTIGAQRK